MREQEYDEAHKKYSIVVVVYMVVYHQPIVYTVVIYFRECDGVSCEPDEGVRVNKRQSECPCQQTLDSRQRRAYPKVVNIEDDILNLALVYVALVY